MKLSKDLIHFNYMNKNGRIYSQNSYDWSEIKQRALNGSLLGELNHPDRFDVLLTDVSHVIKNIEVFQDGVYGEIDILNTPKGRELQSLIDNGVKMVFRPRSVGDVDSNGNVTIKKLFTFDAILASEDAFFNMDLFRYKKLQKILERINNEQHNKNE